MTLSRPHLPSIPMCSCFHSRLCHGRGQGRGPEIYQAQPPNLPPVVAEPNCLNGTPPNDLHFADDPYGQAAFIPEPSFECWVTGCRILGLTALNSLLQYVNWLVWEVCSVN